MSPTERTYRTSRRSQQAHAHIMGSDLAELKQQVAALQKELSRVSGKPVVDVVGEKREYSGQSIADSLTTQTRRKSARRTSNMATT